MPQLDGKRIAIMATNGFEQSELVEPKRRFEEAGAMVHVVAPEAGEIRGWNKTDWGESVAVDRTVDQVEVGDYDALVLPGGQINPDMLRTVPQAVELVHDFFASGKPLAAICHGPWLLIEAGVIRGRQATSYHSIRTDMENAGALWEDSPVVVDEGLITSRDPGDIPAFSDKVIEEVAEGRHQQRKVA